MATWVSLAPRGGCIRNGDNPRCKFWETDRSWTPNRASTVHLHLLRLSRNQWSNVCTGRASCRPTRPYRRGTRRVGRNTRLHSVDEFNGSVFPPPSRSNRPVLYGRSGGLDIAVPLCRIVAAPSAMGFKRRWCALWHRRYGLGHDWRVVRALVHRFSTRVLFELPSRHGSDGILVGTHCRPDCRRNLLNGPLLALIPRPI